MDNEIIGGENIKLKALLCTIFVCLALAGIGEAYRFQTNIDMDIDDDTAAKVDISNPRTFAESAINEKVANDIKSQRRGLSRQLMEKSKKIIDGGDMDKMQQAIDALDGVLQQKIKK